MQLAGIKPLAVPIKRQVEKWTYDVFMNAVSEYQTQKDAGLGDLSEIFRSRLVKEGHRVTPDYYPFGDFEHKLRFDKMMETFEPLECLSAGDILTYHAWDFYESRNYPQGDYIHIADMYRHKVDQFLERDGTRGWTDKTPKWACVPLAKMKNTSGIQHREYRGHAEGVFAYRASFPEFPMTAIELVGRAAKIAGSTDRFSMYLLYMPEWQEFQLPDLDPIILGRFYFDAYAKSEKTGVFRISEHWFKICEWNTGEGTPEGIHDRSHPN